MRIFFVFFLCCFSILFAEEKCTDFNYVNYFIQENKYDQISSEIIYSNEYDSISLFNPIKPGIYIAIRYFEKEVRLFAYIAENSDSIKIYLEPDIFRDYIFRFSSCIDKHVKNNIDYFIDMCIQNKKMTSKNIYNILDSYFNRPYEKISFLCFCKQVYDVEIVKVFPSEERHIIKFKNTSCLDESIFVDPLITKFRSLDSLVKIIIDVEPEKCNWRNLVTDPESFSSKKYDRENYLILSKKDCPTL